MRKTINYRSIEWVGAKEDIIDLLALSLTASPNVDDTRCVVSGEVCEVTHRKATKSEVRLHLATYVDGASKPISPTVTGVAASDLDIAPPPKRANFAEKEIAICIRPTGLAYVCAGRVTPAFVQKYFMEFLKKGTYPQNCKSNFPDREGK